MTSRLFGVGIERVRAAFGQARYARFFDLVRERIERGGLPARSVDVSVLNDAERESLAALLAWPSVPRGPVRVHLQELESALRDSELEVSLTEVLTALGGPVRDIHAERESSREQMGRMWAEAAEHDAMSRRPELEEWLAELRAGLLVRAANAARVGPAQLLELALRFVARLPGDGIHLGVLAAEVAGDAHALDLGTPVTPLVLRAAARLSGVDQVPTSTADRRRLWEQVGVLCDPLSTDALVLGLSMTGDSRLARNSREAAAEGEPIRVTLRELRGEPVVVQTREVFVCENPLVMAAAADVLRNHCAPLVCVEGMPTTAAMHLLAAARKAGARIRFRADFDWGGVRVGNVLATKLEAEPWRFRAADYEDAVTRTAITAGLEGRAVAARFDVNLAGVMQGHAKAIYEEQMIPLLLTDLDLGH